MPRQTLLILASGSPRRRELLREAGYPFVVVPPDEWAESGSVPGETPSALVARLARQKAENVQRKLAAGQAPSAVTPGAVEGAIIVACDTVAECEGAILGKPRDRQHARAMLRQLSGKPHRVFSGLCVWPAGSPAPLAQVAVTHLRMDELSDAQLDAYLDSGQWEGKAGAFGYQDGLDWVHVVEGSESNVVGLPMELLAEMLSQCGWATSTQP